MLGSSMRLEPTDEQDFLRSAVRGVVQREANLAAVRRWTEAGELDEAHAIAVRQGWTGIGVDEEQGGQGGGTMELAIMAEELGRGAVPADRAYAGCLAAAALAEVPDAAPLVARIAEGELAAVWGEDAASPPGTLRREGEGVSGELRLVLAAASAEALVVPLPGGELVRVPLEGGAQPRALVDRTRELATVALDGAAAEPLGTLSAQALERHAARTAVLVSADALGASQRMLDLTVEYVEQREQFGVPVGSFQAVKHLAAQALVDVEALRSAVLYAAWALDAGLEDAPTHAWIARAHAADAAQRTADRALFLHGAVGYTWEHDLQLLFKRAKSDARLYGSGDAFRDRIADALALV
jgi:alkylation response protein AidB-like acyl-CoA dehydrogenase